MNAGRLTVIHTNDSHGRFGDPVGKPGYEAVESLRALLEASPGSIYLDAGDTVSAGNLGFRLAGEPALSTLSELGCAAMCLGNRETHPRKEIFPRKLEQARCPVLCANVAARGQAALPVSPCTMMERNGIRVGVFGVTVPMFTSGQWSQALCDYLFTDPIQAAQALAVRLRPDVDLLIALTHIGHTKDLELARVCPELDAVIGGHSHTRLDAPVWVGEVPVLQAYAYAFFAGEAAFEPAGTRYRLTDWRLHPLRPRLD